MHETAQVTFAYLLENPVLYAVLGLVAGFAARRSVGSEGKSGFFLYLIIGWIGLFLGVFMIFFFGLQEYLENIASFRLLFDFIAAYLGAFFVAAVIHFIKPT